MCCCTNGQGHGTSASRPCPFLSIVELAIKTHESCFATFPVFVAAWLSTWLQQGPAEGDAGCEEEVQGRSTACGGQSRAVAHLSPSWKTPGHAEPAQDCRPSRSVSHSDFVLIGLLDIACPNGCWHQFTCLPRLRPYPVQEHRLLYHTLCQYSACIKRGLCTCAALSSKRRKQG